jgi:hypothetical protein
MRERCTAPGSAWPAWERKLKVHPVEWVIGNAEKHGLASSRQQRLFE